MRAQAPTSRPTWILVLGSLMLLGSGYSLLSGALKLRDPSVVLTVVVNDDTVGSDDEMKIARELSALRTATIQTHRKAVRIEAVAEVLVALFALYATAAVLARDRHGRALTLALGGLVIVYRLAALPVYLALMRDFSRSGADLLARMLLQGAEAGATTKASDLAQRLRTAMVSEPFVIAALGIVAALVLLGFFGGRRGRALYGLLPGATTGGALGASPPDRRA